MAKNDKIKSLGDEVCRDFLGFTPTSNSTKPPHIANGLFRECTGEICDFRDVHEWIASERRKNAISSEDIVKKYDDILLKGTNENPSNIKHVRFLFEEIFNPDNTVYPNYDLSVVNISSHWLVKKSVPAEARIGRYIFEILAKKINGKMSPILELLKKSLEVDDDDLTRILKPIIVFPSDKEKRTVNGVNYPEDSEVKWDSCKETIRKGFDNLANTMIKVGDDKNSLLVLERITNFTCFSAFFYLVNAHSAVYGGKRIPILIDAGENLESIKKASEQCFAYAKTAVEDYFIESLNCILHTEIAHNSKDACLEWIKRMNFKSQTREEEITSAINSYFESFCEDEDEPIHALAHAIQIILYTFDYKNNSPSEFCRVLGTRCGLVGPRGNAAKKRYLVNSFTLETITYSLFSDDDIDDGLELRELSKKALDAYCILLGADVDNEYRVLEEVNIAQSTPGDLRGDLALNAQKLADLYIALGLAHRYADGVTLIGRRQ